MSKKDRPKKPSPLEGLSLGKKIDYIGIRAVVIAWVIVIAYFVYKAVYG